MNELALFAGAGGGILGGKLLGWRTVCAVEWEPYPASVLCARQNDGFFPPFPIWDDVQTFTESRGEELLTLYRAGFHAKTSQLQEKEMDLMEKEAECGEKCHGLLARFDPNMHLWRTVQCSLLEDLNESLQTLPQWGMTVGGELYLLPTLVQTTNENESGLWLTPSTVDIPTRSAESMEKRLEYRKKIGRNGVGAGCLSEQVEWSGKGQPIGYITKETWPTPTAHMAKETNAPSEALRNEPSMASRVGGKLNPMWVEWLMGWPLGFTDLKPLATDKCHSAPQQHGES